MTATTKTANALQHRQAWLLEQAQRCIDCGGYEMYCDWHAGLTLADQELLDADVERGGLTMSVLSELRGFRVALARYGLGGRAVKEPSGKVLDVRNPMSPFRFAGT